MGRNTLIFCSLLALKSIGICLAQENLSSQCRLGASSYKFGKPTTIWHYPAFHNVDQVSKIKPLLESNSFGLQYAKVYIGAQVDNFTSLQPALEKLRRYENMRQPHFTNSGVRLGGYITPATMLYFKAGFMSHSKSYPSRGYSLTPLPKKKLSTTFAPSMGFEWQTAQKLSIGGEIRTAFGRQKTDSQLKSPYSGAILFNVRYSLGKE